MPSRKNRGSSKGQEAENRTGNENEEKKYVKLPGNPNRKPDESISTSDDASDGKYSKTGKRDDDRPETILPAQERP